MEAQKLRRQRTTRIMDTVEWSMAIAVQIWRGQSVKGFVKSFGRVCGRRGGGVEGEGILEEAGG